MKFVSLDVTLSLKFLVLEYLYDRWQTFAAKTKNDASQSRDVKFVVVMDHVWINMCTSPTAIVFK